MLSTWPQDANALRFREILQSTNPLRDSHSKLSRQKPRLYHGSLLWSRYFFDFCLGEKEARVERCWPQPTVSKEKASVVPLRGRNYTDASFVKVVRAVSLLLGKNGVFHRLSDAKLEGCFRRNLNSFARCGISTFACLPL